MSEDDDGEFSNFSDSSDSDVPISSPSRSMWGMMQAEQSQSGDIQSKPSSSVPTPRNNVNRTRPGPGWDVVVAKETKHFNRIRRRYITRLHVLSLRKRAGRGLLRNYYLSLLSICKKTTLSIDKNLGETATPPQKISEPEKKIQKIQPSSNPTRKSISSTESLSPSSSHSSLRSPQLEPPKSPTSSCSDSDFAALNVNISPDTSQLLHDADGFVTTPHKEDRLVALYSKPVSKMIPQGSPVWGLRSKTRTSWNEVSLSERMPQYDAVQDPHCKRLFKRPAVQRHLKTADKHTMSDTQVRRLNAGAKLAWRYVIQRTYTPRRISKKPSPTKEEQPIKLSLNDRLLIKSGMRERCCRVIQITSDKVKVHYESHSEAHDEWIAISSKRLKTAVTTQGRRFYIEPVRSCSLKIETNGITDSENEEEEEDEEDEESSSDLVKSIDQPMMMREESKTLLRKSAAGSTPSISISYTPSSVGSVDRKTPVAETQPVVVMAAAPPPEDSTNTQQPHEESDGESSEEYEDDFV